MSAPVPERESAPVRERGSAPEPELESALALASHSRRTSERLSWEPSVRRRTPET